MPRARSNAIGPEILLRKIVPRALRNWLRRPVQSLTRVRDEVQHLLGRDPWISPLPGWWLRTHPAALRAFGVPLNDPSQRAELSTFVASCQPGMVLYDIGAHFGLFSLAALHYGGNSSRVVAVEASKSAARVLRIHARLNQLTDRFQVVEAAATSRPGWHTMLPVGVIADGYYIEPDSQHPASDLVRVRAVTVDGLVQELGNAPTHLKIDVEGGEVGVLRGASRTLSGDRPPCVFLELHNAICRKAGTEPADCLERLVQLGFRLEAPDGSPLSVERATQPDLIRLVARRPTLHFHAP